MQEKDSTQKNEVQLQIVRLRGAEGDWPCPENVDQELVRGLYRIAINQSCSPHALWADLKSEGVDAKLAEALLMVFKSQSLCEKLLSTEKPITFHDAAVGAWQEFSDNVRKIIVENDLEDQEGAGGKGDLFRNLCRLAWEWGVDPESYRQLLIRAGLADSRASEIKSVLACPKACKAFVVHSNPISWKEALKKSRAKQMSALEVAARDLMGLLVTNREEWETKSGSKGFNIQAGNDGGYTLVDELAGTLTITLRTSSTLQPVTRA